MSPSWPWSELGLEQQVTEREVKRAYATRLKQIDRNDPAVFGALRDAFAAAKNGALRDKTPAKRPRMKDIVERRTGLDDAQPIPLCEPVRPAHDPSGTGTDDTSDIEPPTRIIKAPAPATPDQTEYAEELFADIPSKPAPKTAAPPPWGIGIGKLDILAQEDLAEALSIFQTKFDEALRPWPWHTKMLDALLSLNIAHDLTLRRALEVQIYDNLVHQLGDPELGYPSEMASVIETHFLWATDGVGFHKRMGRRPNAQLVIYGHTRSVPQSLRPAAPQPAKSAASYFVHKAGIFTVLYMISLGGQSFDGPDEVFIQLVALAIFFLVMRWLTGLGTAIVVSIVRLDRLVMRAANWAFPETAHRLATDAGFRKLGTFALTAVFIAIFFITEKYS
ncbi:MULTISPECIES: hypothetical protein [Roseobacteraceae]|uniref:J domain-containing protein n=1 Tax=Pseudosulfitobacter pseudonitzschiae TaxID=1402135 RepID=A0A221K462_9RHOB|nr:MULTISPECIES: hypothetical protein [Roseobacteraceae]ASM73660.1 hypothetical protein SULPSESMR1_02879 [Pseudosulfitobacter pseudonitzschiae]